MRVLIINELYQFGGAEVQTVREGNLLRRFGNESMLITLDDNFENGWIEEHHYNISRKDSRFKRLYQKLFPDSQIVKTLRRLIQDFRPDYIHLNNADAHAISIFKAIKGYKSLQTIRDYGAVCPNGLCIRKDLSMCIGYESCATCTHHCLAGSRAMLKGIWHWTCFRRRDKMRRKSISRFACPSQMLTDYCNRYGLPTTCINNPFDFSMLDSLALNQNTKPDKKIFLYYGQIVEHKGVRQLLEAFSEFARNKNDVELHLVGILPPEYEETFRQLLFQYGGENVLYLGKLRYQDMITKLMTVHTVVIPSLWIENYPNTALEAVSAGRLVLGSERGGMREIIGSERFIFHITDKSSIVEKLQMVYDMSEAEYRQITEENKTRVRKNNALETYYDRLISRLTKL